MPDGELVNHKIIDSENSNPINEEQVAKEESDKLKISKELYKASNPPIIKVILAKLNKYVQSIEFPVNIRKEIKQLIPKLLEASFPNIETKAYNNNNANSE